MCATSIFQLVQLTCGDVGARLGELGEYCGDDGEYCGLLGEYCGDDGEYCNGILYFTACWVPPRFSSNELLTCGELGVYTGDDGEYCGLLGEYCNRGVPQQIMDV